MDNPIQVDLGRIAQDLQIRRVQVESVVQLLDEGNTVPFITRYRKERTGNLNEVAIREIQLRVQRLRDLAERKETILKTIEAQGKLVPDLAAAIRAADNPKRLEDLYLPFKPKKRTKASDARERGLEPLAFRVWTRDETLTDLNAAAQEFVSAEKGVDSVEKVLEGVGHILAEAISEMAVVRDAIRKVVWRTGKLVTLKAEIPEGQGLDYRDYFNYSEPIAQIPPHRVLAINRGDKEGALKVRLEVSRPEVEATLSSQLPLESHPQGDLFGGAAIDALDRLILPSMEREVRRDLTEAAEKHAVDVFARNLGSLLLQPPIPKQVVLAIDPGFKTGCKVAVLDPGGNLLDQVVIFPHAPQHHRSEAKLVLKDLVGKHKVGVVAIGNGTACRETEELIAEIIAEGTRFSQAGAVAVPSGPAAEPDLAPSAPTGGGGEEPPVPPPPAGAPAAELPPGASGADVAAEQEPAMALETTSESEPTPAPGIPTEGNPDTPPQPDGEPLGNGSGGGSHGQSEAHHPAPSHETPIEMLPPITGGAPASDSEFEPGGHEAPPEGEPHQDPASVSTVVIEEAREGEAPSPPESLPPPAGSAASASESERPNPYPPRPAVVREHEPTAGAGDSLADMPPGEERPASPPAEMSGQPHDPDEPVAESPVLAADSSGTGPGPVATSLAEVGAAATAPDSPAETPAVAHAPSTLSATTLPPVPTPAGPAPATSASPPRSGRPQGQGKQERSRPPRARHSHSPAPPPSPPQPHTADPLLAQLAYVIVNEAGASVYSASPVGRDELPDYDATLRSSISIGRRLQDPLAELVKIEPQNIGVGLYQHDVNPKHLKETLETVIASCVNFVGVDLNTASVPLLRHVSGLNQLTARRIVDHRKDRGPFVRREQLIEVEGVGPATFTQAAGFLKVVEGENPLDRTWVHPESYPAVTRLLERFGFDPEVVQDKTRLPELRAQLAQADVPALSAELALGELTLRDIIEALSRPERDPREDLPKPIFKKGVLKLEDLTPGMELQGTVLNVVDFGAFVDIGLKDSGLVHISQLANRYVKSPHDVVSVGDVVTVWVMGVDQERKRVSLTMVKPGTERHRGPQSGGGPRRGGPGVESRDRDGGGPGRGQRQGQGPGQGQGRREGGGARRPPPAGSALTSPPVGAPSVAVLAETPSRRPDRDPGRDRGGPGPGPGGPGHSETPPRHGYGHGPGPRGHYSGPGAGRSPRPYDRGAPPQRPPSRPSRPSPPPPPLSKDALAGNVPLRTFGQLKQLWEARVEGPPEETASQTPTEQTTFDQDQHQPRPEPASPPPPPQELPAHSESPSSPGS